MMAACWKLLLKVPHGKFLEATRKGSNLLRDFASSAFFLSCPYFLPLHSTQQLYSRIELKMSVVVQMLSHLTNVSSA